MRRIGFGLTRLLDARFRRLELSGNPETDDQSVFMNNQSMATSIFQKEFQHHANLKSA
jgi:hypothetical protein